MAPEPQPKKCNFCNREYHGEGDFLQGTSRWRMCSAGNLWFNCSCDSTLVLKKGSFDWFDPENSLESGEKSVFRELSRRKNLPYMSANLMKIREGLNSSEYDPQFLAYSIEKEPLIAAQVIHIYDGLRNLKGGGKSPGKKSVTDLTHALTFIGRDRVLDLLEVAFASSVRVDTRFFSSRKFWEKSRNCGKVARILCGVFDRQNLAPQAYVAGCLCNLGKIVLAFYYPEIVDRMWLKLCDPRTQTTWKSVEREENVPGERVLGKISATLWGLPDFVNEVLEFQDETDQSRIKSVYQDLICITSLASQVSHWIGLDPQLIDQEVLRARLSFFGLKEEDLPSVISQMGRIKQIT